MVLSSRIKKMKVIYRKAHFSTFNTKHMVNTCYIHTIIPVTFLIELGENGMFWKHHYRLIIFEYNIFDFQILIFNIGWCHAKPTMDGVKFVNFTCWKIEENHTSSCSLAIITYGSILGFS